MTHPSGSFSAFEPGFPASTPAAAYESRPAEHRTVHATGANWSAPQFDYDVGVEVRCNAIRRMKAMNERHAAFAWEKRRNGPIAAYGLGLIYTYVDASRRGRHSVAAATRLWKHGPENTSVNH